ncbi:MAG: esterase/lipase family protein [Acidimicrobiales bacterium]
MRVRTLRVQWRASTERSSSRAPPRAAEVGTFVLVHGAFRGGWSWDRVREPLDSAGHETHAPDLTDAHATLDSYIEELVDLFSERDLGEVVLVGHSQGGVVIRAASQRLSDRIARLVYIDAPVPENGQCGFDFRPPGTEAPRVQRGDLVQPRPVVAGEGLETADAEWINARLVAQPVAPSMDAVRLDDARALALPESYVFFGRTPPTLPCAITRAALETAGRNYDLIDAPHDGIVSHPREVADLLLGLLD